VIILCVGWYLRSRFSYRDLSSIVAEMGVAVAPSTILRWVIRYTEEFVRRCEAFELVVSRSWRADEIYIKVKGGWVYLYRAVDERAKPAPLSEP
jgi:transposase-like protein